MNVYDVSLSSEDLDLLVLLLGERIAWANKSFTYVKKEWPSNKEKKHKLADLANALEDATCLRNRLESARL